MHPWPVKSLFLLLLLSLGLAGCGGSAGAAEPTTAPLSSGVGHREVRVAAASDLKFALDDVIASFRKEHGDHRVSVTYGSSGTFHAQLLNRAPFDLYLSADLAYPAKLIDAGLATSETLFVYGHGRLCVWVPISSKLDLADLGLRAVADPAVHRVAIANPLHAPYGRAAEAALRHTGLYEPIRKKLVLGENVAQAAQFVEGGGADIGIIALPLALAPAMRDRGRFVEVPAGTYPAIVQGGVILNWARDRDATVRFHDYLVSRPGRSLLAKYGFSVPDDEQKGDAWTGRR